MSFINLTYEINGDEILVTPDIGAPSRIPGLQTSNTIELVGEDGNTIISILENGDLKINELITLHKIKSK